MGARLHDDHHCSDALDTDRRTCHFGTTEQSVMQFPAEAYVYQYDDGMDNVDGAEQSVRIKLCAETEDEKVFTVKRMTEKLPKPDDLDDENNPLPPRPDVVATLVNLGATGFCHQELFNGERYNVEELADYQILSARWHEPAVMCKHKIEQLPTELRQMWEHWLAEHNGI